MTRLTTVIARLEVMLEKATEESREALGSAVYGSPSQAIYARCSGRKQGLSEALELLRRVK